MDNITEPTQEVDNSNAQTAVETTQEPNVASAATPASTSTGGWKSQINTDLKNSPLLSKFEDTPEGLNKALESHANLEKLLGHEKVPIPKDAKDVEGWNRFAKAMGIPDKAEGYGIPDAKMPDGWNGAVPNKNEFAEIAHAHKLTPAQANGLWETFIRKNIEGYQSAVNAHKEQIVNTVNQLKGEWGDAYETNVELGQMVINKFSTDPEMNDFITATLSQDPRGIKFLARLGDQFAENKMGDFQMKRFSLGPEQAQEEIHKIMNDPNHAYVNPKASAREHQAAVDYVNSLHASIAKARGQS